MIKRTKEELTDLREKALANGMSYDTFRGRIRRGHSDEDILSDTRKAAGRKPKVLAKAEYQALPSIRRMREAKQRWLLVGDLKRAEVVGNLLTAAGVRDV